MSAVTADLRSPKVSRDDVDLCLHKLIVYHPAPPPLTEEGQASLPELVAVTRENVQILVNEMFGKLERSVDKDGVQFLLCSPATEQVYKLPRSGPIPAAADPDTRFERFMKQKGMTKDKKRLRKVYDEVGSKWVPRYGGKGIKALKRSREFIIPATQVLVDSDRNPFTEERDERKQGRKKQKFQEFRNKAEKKGPRSHR